MKLIGEALRVAQYDAMVSGGMCTVLGSGAPKAGVVLTDDLWYNLD